MNFCLYYHIGQCLGYCQYNVPEEQIKNIENEILTFLKGNEKNIVAKITKMRDESSGNFEFEKALEMQNLLNHIEEVMTKQEVEINTLIDTDVFGYAEMSGYLSICHFFIRGGKIVEKKNSIFPTVDEIGEELNTYIANVYSKNILKPKNIFVPDIANPTLLESYLDTTVLIPKRGSKKAIYEMANENALVSLNMKFELIKRDESRTLEACNELSNILNIPNLSRIEMFDIAHLFGTYNVAGMVAFIDGKPSKNDYLKSKVSMPKNDDNGAMREDIDLRCV